MLKNLLLVSILFFAWKNSFSQVESSTLIIDSIQSIEFVTFSPEEKHEVIGYDQYFVYNDKLYNNAIECFPSFCKTKYSDAINKVGRYIKNSSFYSKLFNHPGAKEIDLNIFINKYNSIFSNDSLQLFDFKTLNFKIFERKLFLIFYILECKEDNVSLLSGGGSHNKIFEKYFYPIWRGKFLLPLQFAKASSK